MNIINIPLIKTEDAYGAIHYELPSGVILGQDGENLTTELRIHFGDIEMIEAAEYYLEMSNGQGKEMDKHDGYVSAKITADMLTVGDVLVQLTWSWLEVDEKGKEVNPVDKTKSVYWRVLDSVELDETLQKEYPEILAMLMANLSKTGVEMRYNEGTRFVEWSYLDTDEWFTLFSADDVTEGASAYQTAVKNGFEGTEQEWLDSLHGKDGKTPVKGEDYFDGKDGFSPEVTAEEVEDGVEITTTHKDADPTVVKVKHGKDGTDGKTPVKGKDYKDGEDGFNPEVTLEETETGVKITTTHKDADPTSVEVKHGKDGYTPQKNVDYFDGKDGYTPQKNVDYFDGKDYVITFADYEAIAEVVISQLVDGDNLEY
jgi:hypothetical protein